MSHILIKYFPGILCTDNVYKHGYTMLQLQNTPIWKARSTWQLPYANYTN